MREIHAERAKATALCVSLKCQISQKACYMRLTAAGSSGAGIGRSRDELLVDATKDLDYIRAILVGMESQTGKLHREMALVRSQGAVGQEVQIGRFTFSHYPAVKLFSETLMHGNYRVCLDAVSVLHAIDGSYVNQDQATG
jgi:hypothetical protein